MRVRMMGAAQLFLAILIAATMLWIPCKCYYKYNTERRMGSKLQHLTRELVLDVEMKIKAVQGYRDQYYKSLQYQLGDIVYEMRNYFKIMVRLYQISHRDLSYGQGNYHTTIESLLQIQRMAMEIETKVKMVQGWQYKRETKAEHRIRMLDPLRSRPAWPEPIRHAAARARMQQRAGARPPPRARPPPPAPRGRINKKWRHVTDDDFHTI